MRIIKAVKWLFVSLLVIETATLSTILGIISIPRLAGIQPYSVLTGSMEPTLPVGSMAFIDTGVSGEDMKEGDIVAFSIDAIEESVVTHRVTKNNAVAENLETKGDANQFSDPNTVGYEQVVGKETMTIPHLGYMVMVIKQYRLTLIVLACLFCTIAMLASRIVSSTENAIEKIELEGELCTKAQLQEH